MRQTAAAKKAWIDLPRRHFSVFKFSEYPAIVDFLGRNIPNRTAVILLGGGRGAVGELCKKPGCSFVNLELGEVREPFVPTMVHDIEEPFSRDLAEHRGRRVYLVSCFSLEYTDIPLVVGNGATALRENERWIVVSHHPNSFILAGFRDVEKILPAAEILLRLLEADGSCWLEIGKSAEELLLERLPWSNSFRIMETKRIHDLSRFVEDQVLLHLKDDSKASRILSLLGKVRLAIEGLGTAEEVMDLVRKIYGSYRGEFEATRKLFENPIFSAYDLERLFSGQFSLVDGENFFDKRGNELAVGAVFKKI